MKENKVLAVMDKINENMREFGDRLELVHLTWKSVEMSCANDGSSYTNVYPQVTYILKKTPREIPR